jgi:hypothetical protein
LPHGELRSDVNQRSGFGARNDLLKTRIAADRFDGSLRLKFQMEPVKDLDRINPRLESSVLMAENRSAMAGGVKELQRMRSRSPRQPAFRQRKSWNQRP